MIRHFATYCFYPVVEKYLERDVRSKWKFLHRYYRKSFEIRENIMKKRVVEQVQLAYRKVPYYRDLFKQIRFEPDKLDKDFKFFFDIPTLDKATIQEHGDRLLNENINKHDLTVCKTGGSTGISMLVYYDQEAVDWTSATNMYALELAGRKRHMKELHLASRYPEIFPLKARIKEHVKCFAMNRSNIFTHSFNSKDLEVIWRKLKARRPYLVQGHPSTFYALSSFLQKKRYNAKNIIRIFESTGETLDYKKRKKIEQVLGCNVVNRYGNAEFGIIAYEHLASGKRMQVMDYMVFPEALECGIKTMKEIVVTGLTNTAMPMLRYRCGDFGDLCKNDKGYYYDNIVGRVHDIVKIGEKSYPTHYLQDILDRMGGIVEFQVQQITENKIKLILVFEDSVEKGYVQNKLNSWFPEQIVIETSKLSELKRTGWRGKFRYLVKGE